MKPDSVGMLRCPRCRAERMLTLTPRHADDVEAREGSLNCLACEGEFTVTEGIADLLYEAPEFVRREAAGWATNIFAEQGLDAIAVDIAMAELQGLRTAQYYLDEESPSSGSER